MPPDGRLRALLSRARLVLRLRALLFGLEASCALGLFLALCFAGLSEFFGMGGHAWTLVPALSATAGLAAAGAVLAARKRGPVYLAWKIERGFPGFDSFLITAAEFLGAEPLPGQARVLLSSLKGRLDAVSPWRLPRARAEIAARLAFAASLAAFAGALALSGGGVFDSAGRFLWGSPPARMRVLAVHPGDADVRETDELNVAALVSGSPERVSLRLGGEEFSMAREGGLWRAGITPVTAGGYVVEARREKEIARSKEFSVRLLPTVEVALAFRVRPPRYTRFKESVLGGPDIRVPEGSVIEAILTGEEQARFTFGGKAHRMRRAGDGALLVRLRPARSGTYELDHSRGKLTGTIVVVRDSAPELSVAAEGLEKERLALRVRAADDYGLGECTVRVSARGLSKEFRVPVPEGALEYTRKVLLPESFTSSLPDGTELVYWAEARDFSPEGHVVRTRPRKWTLNRPESQSPLFGSRRPKRKLRGKPRPQPPPGAGGPPPPPSEGGTRGMETLEEERPPPSSASAGEGEAADYVSEQTSPPERKGAGEGTPSPRDAGAESAGKGGRPSGAGGGAGTGGKGGPGAGGQGEGGGGAGGSQGEGGGGGGVEKRPRDGGPKTGRETGPGPGGRETVDKGLVDGVVPDADELARALAERKGDVRGGRGKRAKEGGEDASTIPQASRLAGGLGFSDRKAGTPGADYDELYRAIAREYFRRLARPGR